MDDSPVKVEESASGPRAGYKSWKKKYRKMRITFDQKMHQGEELHKQEHRAAALVKRLAIENDRLLDLLLEINNSPQIPPEKQIDVSLEPTSDAKEHGLPMDQDHSLRRENAGKKLQDLVSSVPHSSYNHAKESLPAIVDDLKAPEGETHPADFLSADDVDNYLYEVDLAIDPDARINTLAPRAISDINLHNSHHLKNPTSVTNWLRKHAPKIFLQDTEGHGDAEDAEGASVRKPRASKSERSGRAPPKIKRVSAAARAAASAAAAAADDMSMDEEPDVTATNTTAALSASAAATPVVKGKRKRNEPDGGYKPRGSSTRPSKKKRKSEAAEGTPSVRKSKKDAAAAGARDD